jgi:hypothetical protein
VSADLTAMEGRLSGVIAAALDDLLDVRALLRAIVKLQEDNADAARLACIAEARLDAVVLTMARHV